MFMFSQMVEAHGHTQAGLQYKCVFAINKTIIGVKNGVYY